MSDGWAPAINDRIIYCGSRTDYNDQPGTITDIKVIEQCPSIVVILDTGQKVTTVRKTLRPERTTVDPCSRGGLGGAPMMRTPTLIGP